MGATQLLYKATFYSGIWFSKIPNFAAVSLVQAAHVYQIEKLSTPACAFTFILGTIQPFSIKGVLIDKIYKLTATVTFPRIFSGILSFNLSKTNL